MRKFDDSIPARDFDNFQFVNFTSIMEKQTSPEEKEASFALAALMEVPFQYKASMELGILGHVTGKAKRVNPRPPPVPFARRQHSLTALQLQAVILHNQAMEIRTRLAPFA
ncbi:hypothetical protein J5N97_016148 [Dioscorea zingiberensis]|uniref:Copine C-terminal domain-containing protein n=1 Tax=Dioscorea zingiberensis TaxID=325984 RepID=A0A9D5CKJ2_9LILI|nr:hypothetical protein J5N97_016148 [Dioscorea zingiberensis]